MGEAGEGAGAGRDGAGVGAVVESFEIFFGCGPWVCGVEEGWVEV